MGVKLVAASDTTGAIYNPQGINVTELAAVKCATGSVAAFEDGRLLAMEPTESLGGKKGTRRKGEVLQLGLASWEIRGIHARLKRLLKRVDSGKITTF